MSAFLHGVETLELPNGHHPITAVRSAIIGLVGTAPMHTVASANQSVNVPVVCLNAIDDAKYFGVDTVGYTIPAALAAIRKQEKQGAGAIVIVVNVFDPAVHFTAVIDESHLLVANVLQLAHLPIMDPVVVKDSTGVTTYTLGTDYTFDYTLGTVTRVTTGTIPLATSTLHTSYHNPDPTAPTSTSVIGATSGSGVRSGMQAWKNARTLFGYGPRILIAPGFSSAATVASALAVAAAGMRAIDIIDAPSGTSVANAITGRGVSGAINFNTADERTIPAFPYVKSTLADGSIGLVPFSAFIAGAIAVKDATLGYWYSPSNTQVQGIFGTEIPLTFTINDPNCEVNQLNAAGITTVASDFGTGYLIWGNHNAAFPGSADASTFVSVRRTRDIIEDSIEYASIQRADQPVTQAFIDGVVEDVNIFMRTLKGRGALIDGQCWFDPAKNSTASLATGQVTWSYDMMPPVPCERMTFESTLNTGYLAQLLKGNS